MPDEFAQRYVEVALALGRHRDGLIDAYYGPAELRERSEAMPVRPCDELGAAAKAMIGEIDRRESGLGDVQRESWMRAQLVGLATTAAVIGGESIDYLDEIEQCYQLRPQLISDDEIAVAHRVLADSLPGTGTLESRVNQSRSDHVVAVDRMRSVIADLEDDFRARTAALFSLPDGERVEFELVTDQPWSGFNYYQGQLVSHVAINVDLPVTAMSLAHLVAHEAYPGHHTESCLKEVGLFRARSYLEESVAVIGTPSCVIAEGLADLGIEILLGERWFDAVEPIFAASKVRFEVPEAEAMSSLSEASSRIRGRLSVMLHRDGIDVDEVERLAAKWLLVTPERAKQMVRFLTDPTWRAYVFCYGEGVRLCRDFVQGDPRRFARLLNEQLTPQAIS